LVNSSGRTDDNKGLVVNGSISGGDISDAGRHFILNLFLCIALIFVTGCGYHLRGGGDALPEDIRTVALISFVNKTYDAEIELLISSALSAELSKGSRLDLVPEPEADAIVSGTVLSIKDTPVSFSSSDVASEYRITVKVDVVLTRSGGNVIWKGKGIEEVADYQSVPGNIEETERNRDEARQKLAVEMADLIYDRLFEGF
jgi:outer membrane lipopolysaccharide assembly protein LptE/RlpB